MQAVLITNTYFETDSGGNSVPIFEAGKHYPLNDASQRQVARGNAQIVNVPDDQEKVQSEPVDAEGTSNKPSAKPAAKATSARRQTVSAADEGSAS